MPIDAITALSFAIQSNPGVYVLLLGSGTSRAAGIPTGWEVTLDLIGKVAASEGNPPADPKLWYREKFNTEPDYSVLLNELGNTASERQAILRQYFEPTDQDREVGQKVPTAAHKAIATLVAKGFIRVIITTNFDRLVEQALDAEGVTPTVVSSADAAEGVTPLAHTRCMVIKVNGDYLDTRIKNTTEELSSYDPRLAALIDRVFDEYGLIICGWSGAWDTALVGAIERIRSRRYTTFWATRGVLLGAAQQLAQLRSAVQVSITDADSFFKSLRDRVLSIAQFNSEHPLSTVAAVASLKRFLQDPSRRIDLHDLVIADATAMKTEVDSLALPTGEPTSASIFHRLQQYEAVALRPATFFSTLAFFSEEQHHPLILEALRWFISPAQPRTSYVAYLEERLHPAVLVFYTIAVAAVQANKPELLKLLFLDLKVKDHENKLEPAIRRRLPEQVVKHNIAKTFPGYEGYLLPMSARYFDVLKSILANIFPSEVDFTAAFHIVEVLSSLSHLDQRMQAEETHQWAPAGHFFLNAGWAPDPAPETLRSEADNDYASSIVGRSKLFSSAGRFGIVFQRFAEIMNEYRRQTW
jgi:hypothetical protein